MVKKKSFRKTTKEFEKQAPSSAAKIHFQINICTNVLILRFLSRSLAISKLLIKYATNEPEGVQLKSILTKSDFLLCVHVVVETLNLETEFHVFV